jgi:hypothetical protein
MQSHKYSTLPLCTFITAFDHKLCHNYPDPIKNMDAALQQIRDAYAQASADERQQIQAQLTDLRNDIFTDWEVLFSLAMGVSSLPHSTPKQYRKLSNITTASSL